MLMKIKVFMFAMAALTTLPAFAQLPSYYPADYQKIVDGAKKRAKWWSILRRILRRQPR